jgi:hypothetical protein
MFEKNKTIGIMVLIALIVLTALVVFQFTTKETVTIDGKTGVVTKKYFSFKK